MHKEKKRISSVITIWLIIILAMTCVFSAILTFISLSKRSEDQTVSLVRQNVEDVSTDIAQLADESLLQYVDQFVDEESISPANLEDPDDLTKELSDFYPEQGIEINIVNNDGIVLASSVPEYVGYDFHLNEKAAEFLVLVDGKKDSFIQEMRENANEENVLMKYAGKRFPDGSGFLEVGLSKDLYYQTISSQGRFAATNRRIGKNGYLLVCDEKLNILNSYHNVYTGENVNDAGIDIDPARVYTFENKRCDVYGIPSFVCINYVEGIYIIGVYSVSEAITNINTMLKASIILELGVFAVLLFALIILLRRIIVNNMVRVNSSLEQITEGNLDEKIDVRDTVEFNNLSDDINQMVDRLKGYIKEAEERINADLEVAKAIQTSVLPNVFPPFPDQNEFELFADMRAAKEVGGDFYDFYMIGHDTLGFLIADVSGKSIPGAMFMMTGKAIIKSLAESGKTPADVFEIANEKLCEGNDADLFITAWMGYLDLDTGIVHVANAGHNPPVLIRDGKAEYVNLDPGFVLAGLEGMTYEEQTIELKKGDILYLYTDGVTEAMNSNDDLYGEERLIELLTFNDDYPEPSGQNGIAGAVCEMVKADVDGFVKGAEQSDDITMLCIRYLGSKDDD